MQIETWQSHALCGQKARPQVICPGTICEDQLIIYEEDTDDLIDDGQPEGGDELLAHHAATELSACMSDQTTSICGMLAILLSVQ